MLLILTLFPSDMFGKGIFMSATFGSASAALLSSIARDLGKDRQKKLYKKNEAAPTTKLLRFSEQFPSKEKKEAYHNALREIIPSFPGEMKTIESNNPERADNLYMVATSYLREFTRDTTTYKLVFEENVAYTFRRNLWRMKPLGIVNCALSSGLILFVLISSVETELSIRDVTNLLQNNSTAFTALLTNIFIMCVLCSWVTPKWVKQSANAYARRLMNTSLTIAKKQRENDEH